MLELLFGSKIRSRLLKLFLLHPEKSYSLKDIRGELKLPSRSIEKELANLEKIGIIGRGDKSPDTVLPATNDDGGAIGPKPGRRNFTANTGFILFEEIKALLIKTQILYEKDFIERVARLGKIRLLILTGVFVGNLKSPIDLLAVGRFNRIKFSKIIRDLESELGKEINYTFLDTAEFTYRRNITDVFLYDILEGNKIILIDELGL